MKSEHPPEAMDLDLLLDRLGGDKELLRELATLYFVEYPKQFDDLRSAVAARDLKRTQQAAHKLKGTARNFAAAPAAKVAHALEQTKDFGDGASISEMTNHLAQELHRLKSALEGVLERL